MKLNFDWWRWLVIISFAMLVMSFFCRCTTTKYVPMVQYKEKIVSKTDSFFQADSVYIHDSVFVFKNGDTVFQYRWKYKDRFKYLYMNKTDTLMVVDSIPYKVPYKVEVEKSLSIMQKIFIWLGKFSTIALIISIISIYFLAKNRKS